MTPQITPDLVRSLAALTTDAPGPVDRPRVLAALRRFADLRRLADLCRLDAEPPSLSRIAAALDVDPAELELAVEGDGAPRR